MNRNKKVIDRDNKHYQSSQQQQIQLKITRAAVYLTLSKYVSQKSEKIKNFDSMQNISIHRLFLRCIIYLLNLLKCESIKNGIHA